MLKVTVRLLCFLVNRGVQLTICAVVITYTISSCRVACVPRPQALHLRLAGLNHQNASQNGRERRKKWTYRKGNRRASMRRYYSNGHWSLTASVFCLVRRICSIHQAYLNMQARDCAGQRRSRPVTRVSTQSFKLQVRPSSRKPRRLRLTTRRWRLCARCPNHVRASRPHPNLSRFPSSSGLCRSFGCATTRCSITWVHGFF